MPLTDIARARGRRDEHRKANIVIPFNKFVVKCQGQQQIDSESEWHDFHQKRCRAQHLAGVKSTSMFQSKVPLSSHVMPRNFSLSPSNRWQQQSGIGSTRIERESGEKESYQPKIIKQSIDGWSPFRLFTSSGWREQHKIANPLKWTHARRMKIYAQFYQARNIWYWCTGGRGSQSQIENHEPVIRAVRGKFIWKFNFSVEQKRTRREHRLLCVYAAHAIVSVSPSRSKCMVECFGWHFSGWIVDKNTIIFGRLIIIKCVQVQCSAISTM